MQFLEQGLEGVGHLGDLRHARDARVAGQRMDAAIQFVDLLQARRFVLGLDQTLEQRAQGRQRGGQALDKGIAKSAWNSASGSLD